MAPYALNNGLVIRHGDTLVIAVDKSLPLEYIDEASEHLKRELPGVKVVFIEASQLVVYRPSEVTT